MRSFSTHIVIVAFLLTSCEALLKANQIQFEVVYSKRKFERTNYDSKILTSYRGLDISSQVIATPTARILPNDFKNNVTFWRRVALGLFSIGVFNYDKIDSAIQAFYKILLEFPFFHHYAFEPVLASTCFAFYIGMYALVDYCIPELWKYRIQPQGRGDSMVAWKDRLKDALSFEVPLYLAFWIPFGGVMRARKIQASVTLAVVIQEVIAALLIYDGLFFLGHSVLHRSNFLYKHVHAKHHNQKVVRAGDSVRHTFLDGFWDVVCAVAALMILKANALSRSVFNIVAIGLIVEAHSGSNFPWSPCNILPFNMMAGPQAHDKHHAQGGLKNLQKFFTYLDKMFGSSN